MTNTPPATIHLGDCIEVMRALPENSVDAIVTDPPYGLGFMGKAWDELPPGEEWARECLRVLKPGGHLLAFGGSRTWHRLAVAIEDAGFEVRDSIAWLYGSGFPKSLDVSKAIDKARDEDAEPRREVCRMLRAALAASGRKRSEIDGHFGTANVSQYWFSPDRNSQVPPVDKWPWVRDFLGIGPDLDAEVWRLNGRKGTPGEAWDQREVIEERRVTDRRGDGTVVGLGHGGNADITAPATDDARKWAGFGTALKPAFEPIVVARKPLVGTVAANVLAHGTGALNIDGCRVTMGEGDRVQWNTTHTPGAGKADGWDRPWMADAGEMNRRNQAAVEKANTAGRWPANVVLDESQAAALDQMSGVSAPKPRREGRRGGTNANPMSWDASNGDLPGVWPADPGGGASRFFYVAKAATRERPKVDGVAHPTVKPLALMRWLVRLVTPPGGTVLEPFAGSGTTVEACALEGFACVAIEREPDYLPLIQARLARAQDAQPEPVGPSLFDMGETA